jgi:hypothetical protein
MNDQVFDVVTIACWSVLGVAYAAFWIWLTVRIVNGRRRWARRLAAVAIALPVIYFLTSGPISAIAFETHVAHTPVIRPNGTAVVEATSETNPGVLFAVAYAPLFWVAEQSWGDPVFSYWELFQNRDTSEGL